MNDNLYFMCVDIAFYEFDSLYDLCNTYNVSECVVDKACDYIENNGFYSEDIKKNLIPVLMKIS